MSTVVTKTRTDSITLYPNARLTTIAGMGKFLDQIKVCEVEVSFELLSKIGRNRLAETLRRGWIDGGYQSAVGQYARLIFDAHRFPFIRLTSRSRWCHDVTFSGGGIDWEHPRYDDLVDAVYDYARMLHLAAPRKDAREPRRMRMNDAVYIEFAGAIGQMDVIEPLFRQHVWTPRGLDPARKFRDIIEQLTS